MDFVKNASQLKFLILEKIQHVPRPLLQLVKQNVLKRNDMKQYVLDVFQNDEKTVREVWKENRTTPPESVLQQPWTPAERLKKG